jgi:hypothetical protein
MIGVRKKVHTLPNQNRQPGKRKSRIVFFRISAEEYKRLERVAELQKRRISDVARNSLTELLDRLESGGLQTSLPEQAHAVRLEIIRLTAEVNHLVQLCMEVRAPGESTPG